MKRTALFLFMVCAVAGLVQISSPPAQQGAAASQVVRPIGVVEQIQSGGFILHADSGPLMTVQFPEGATVVRVAPGAKDLKGATKISLNDLRLGDRVLVRGRVSDDQKSVLASAVIVMSQADLTKARETERLEWQRRGTGGLVKAINSEAKEITISVPNTPPTPGNPTHPVTISLAANAMMLRYAPDSVKFSDAKPSAFEEIKVGDQVRALGAKSDDGTHFSAEKLVSGTFRNIGATVIAVDAQNGDLTVKDLATNQPLRVRTNADSRLHRLAPSVAQMIAAFNSGGGQGAASPGQAPGGHATGGAPGNSTAGHSPAGGTEGGSWRGNGAGPERGSRDFQQMLDHSPALSLRELKVGEPVVVVSTAGAKPSEVTAIVLLAGVEPILAARPKGSNEVVLGSWSMGMAGGEGEQ